MSGKGSAPRPFGVDAQTYANNFDAIFGKKKNDSLNNRNSGTDSKEEGDESSKGTCSNENPVSSSA